MAEGQTTASVQRYLDALGDAVADSLVRELLYRSVRRLQLLCANMLHRKYARLTRPPLNLEEDEMLSAVVERLLKALRVTRPTTVRGFFALANQHMRWELNDLARRLDRHRRQHGRRPSFCVVRCGCSRTPGWRRLSRLPNRYS